jgi:hypothetical protein
MKDLSIGGKMLGGLCVAAGMVFVIYQRKKK